MGCIYIIEIANSWKKEEFWAKDKHIFQVNYAKNVHRLLIETENLLSCHGLEEEAT